MPTTRPSKAELADAAGRTIEDVIAPGLDILFVGINPGLWSGLTGYHFANPANRFWRAIALAGLTDRVLEPSEQRELLDHGIEQRELLDHGIGIVNLVARTTASAAELGRDELRAGGRALEAKVERFRPRTVAFLGISTYKIAFDARAVEVGLQAHRLAGARAGSSRTRQVSTPPEPCLDSPWRTARCASRRFRRGQRPASGTADAGVGGEEGGLVGALPRQVEVRPAEVAVRRGLAVDRPAQVERAR